MALGDNPSFGGDLFSLSIKLLFFSRELLDVFGTFLFCHFVYTIIYPVTPLA